MSERSIPGRLVAEIISSVMVAVLVYGVLVYREATAADPRTEPVGSTGARATPSPCVVIERDEWGVAHVHGKTHADAFFGMGYAQAEDYFWQLEDTCIRSLGRYAEVAGDEGLSSDILNRSFEIVRRSQDDFLKLHPAHQAMAAAYTEGINRFFATHPQTKPRLLQRFEPWYVLAMDRQMILDFIYRRVHVKRPGDRGPNEIASLNNVHQLLLAKRSINRAGLENSAVPSWEVETEPLSDFAVSVQAATGSNAWAIAGTKTVSGSAMLFINPHQPWYGTGQFHESHIRSDEGLNFSGASFFGTPFPTIGHNDYLGWTYTVNNPDIADAWRITFDKASEPLQYRFDGAYRTAIQWTESLKVKSEATTLERPFTFRKTHQGPIVGRENETTFLAVQVAGLFDLKRVDQAWGMVRARNFAEWRTAMSYRAIPMFNVVYADRDGNIFYAYNATIPVRDPAFDWTNTVDGSDSRTDWKGIHTFDQLPQVLNPKSGYVQSCNGSPFRTLENSTENPSPTRFPRYMLEDGDLDTRRSQMSRLLLEKATALTFDQLQTMAYDTTLYWAMTEIPKLKAEFVRLQMQNPALANDVAAYFTHLQDWDFKSSLSSTQTTLCLAWYEELYGFGYPAETLKAEYAADRLTWFLALKKAAEKLSGLHGNWKFPWGKAHRLQRMPNQPDVQHAGARLNNMEPSLPIAGAPGPLGIVHTVYSTPEIPYLRPQRFAVVGASYMSVVEFSNPVRSVSVMPFGSSGVRKSPHFFDQARLYATEQFKSAWFSKEEITQHVKTKVELSR